PWASADWRTGTCRDSSRRGRSWATTRLPPRRRARPPCRNGASSSPKVGSRLDRTWTTAKAKTNLTLGTLHCGVMSMSPSAKRLGWVGWVGVLVGSLGSSSRLAAQAGNQPNQGNNALPAAQASFRSMPMATSYAPTPLYPYYPGYYYDPYAGYLSGAADVINAQGQFMVSTQQAYLQREQVRQARLDNRRRAFDEYLYERERRPTQEDE